MKTFQRLPTNKLFYKKYAYKISTTAEKKEFPALWNTFFQLKYSTNLKFKHRFENQSCSFFSEDRDTYQQLIEVLDKFIVETWEPKNQTELEFLKNNRKQTIVKQYPHKAYTHKIFLKIMSPEQRSNLVQWIEKYPKDTFKISETTKRYLEGGRYWTRTPFILVKTPQMFTLTALAFNDSIKSSEEFVLRENIK